MHPRRQRVWLWIATIAIIGALVLMLLPHGHAAHSAAWLAILPLLILGFLPLPRLQPRPVFTDSRRTPDALILPTRFERPPPSYLA